jgi:3-oxoadipate enol-lactonase
MWDAQVDALRGSYRILRYDQRGHGDTDVPPAPASIEQLAADAAALLEYFDVERATFVGVSMGAATALCLAGRRNSRVGRAVVVDGQAKAPPSARAAWDERIALARSDGMGALAEATVQRWFRPAFIEADPPVLPSVRSMITATPLGGFVACARALQFYDVSDLLPEIAIPVLLLAGADDGAVPGAMRDMQPHIPNAWFHEIAEAGHLPNLDQPDAFLAAVTEFMAAA